MFIFTILMKSWRMVLDFLSFKGLTHACLSKVIAHNEYLRPWFFKDSDPISAESAAQILSFNLA